MTAKMIESLVNSCKQIMHHFVRVGTLPSLINEHARKQCNSGFSREHGAY